MTHFRITSGRYLTTSLLALAIIGATMTMPEIQSLPGQISQQGESPLVARIGTVVDVVESTSITVQISGSPALVTASYAFPAYQPLLGDLVYVTKQDSQWFVLGTMSGPINTVLRNPSFEDGVIGGLPDNWTTTVVASPAGVPTFTKEFAANPVNGRFQGFIRNASAGVAGTSILDIFSSAEVAAEGQRWAQSHFLVFAAVNVNAALVVQSGNTQVQTFIQFLNSGGGLISEESAYAAYLGSNVIIPTYLRTITPAGFPYATSPPGTEFVRLRIRATLTMNTNSLTEIYLDQMALRTPDM